MSAPTSETEKPTEVPATTGTASQQPEAAVNPDTPLGEDGKPLSKGEIKKRQKEAESTYYDPDSTAALLSYRG